jgi:hypothetical protein
MSEEPVMMVVEAQVVVELKRSGASACDDSPPTTVTVHRETADPDRRCHRKAGSLEGRRWGRHCDCGAMKSCGPAVRIGARAPRSPSGQHQRAPGSPIRTLPRRSGSDTDWATTLAIFWDRAGRGRWCHGDRSSGHLFGGDAPSHPLPASPAPRTARGRSRAEGIISQLPAGLSAARGGSMGSASQ